MRFLIIFVLIFSLGCSSSDPTGNQDPTEDQDISYQTVNAFPNLSFNQPVDLQHAGDNSGRLFVVEKAGLIQVFNNESSAESTSTFLDIREQVDDRGNEEGLLGLAFHPNYESNGYFYVNYTASDPARTIIARFQVSDQNPDEANEASEQEILTFAQPYDNHNGGQLAFGPDGYLYIAVGDGGSGGDPQGNGQDRSTLLGSILRIDVNGQENGNNYAIPTDNPYAGNDEGYREEIFAHGLRNPWRFSFDTETGRLWAGDVGQNSYEEINIIESGNNYGWNIMEGTHCYEPSSGCDQSGLTMPVWEYGRDEGISVTGGYAYRGPTLETLTGSYIYGDYGSGKIWALDYSDSENPSNTELLEADFPIASFGVDSDNKLYICGFDGNIYQLEEVEG
ncbi:PQQ-dependent sugar dehydrogenase [Fodinibius sp.]|uniref:PQQ-dependent sugar dehydrogenase n=1 Tax=Fodinibius sp. TaxID=1872440 RepID=UPI002ACDD605|nr:PQQ-dependent sugar dehydrogenase [Fodinibius sp.]MDZ7658675.1 PQQ-dependent sugar dehydrogenase [Fodinibius sp.]